MTPTFLSDAVNMASIGVRSLESDSFSECFRPIPRSRLYNSGPLYVFSFATRYFILFPLRLAVLCVGTLFTGLVFFYGLFTHDASVVSLAFKCFFRLFTLVFNCYIAHHGTKRMIREPHVYVSNHTSFVDFLILSSHKFCHACISESHGGLFGFIFNTIISKNGSISFRRSDRLDRQAVTKKVREHVLQNKVPMLVFPEGTCVNNDYIVLFQKGIFEMDDIKICPVGIRYKKSLMDPYWNRRSQCFTLHLLYLMTRWRVEADVYWMDPVARRQRETPVQFSHRVKNLIAAKTGLRNTLWNGMFKSSPVLKDRQLFKEALLSVYNKIRKGVLESEKERDSREGREYIMDRHVASPGSSSGEYFGRVSYELFMIECCREYLRMKATPRKELAPPTPSLARAAI